MIKALIFSLCLFFISSIAVAQSEEQVVEKLKKEDLLIDVFVGYPNWGVYNIETYFSSVPSSTVNSTSGIVPLGLRAEYFLSNEISFTLDASYTQWAAEWSYSSVVFDSLGQGTQEEFDNSFEGSRFAFQLGANYHIPDLDGDNLDLYMGFAIGTNNISTTLAQEQVDLNDATVRDQDYFLNSGFILNSASLARTPISARLRIGGRYFFKPNVALNAELGTGIRTLSVGLTFKL
jgi:hypothetical protein